MLCKIIIIWIGKNKVGVRNPESWDISIAKYGVYKLLLKRE